jgi:peroxiredoxin
VLLLLVFAGVRAFQQRDLAAGAAPDLVAVDIHGRPTSLGDYRGRPVLVHFWATWCGVCRAEQHNISSVAEDLPTLSVASLSGDSRDVAAYARQHGLALPIISDASGALAKRFGVSAYPTTFIVNADGEIRHAEVGYTTELGLRARMWLSSL